MMVEQTSLEAYSALDLPKLQGKVYDCLFWNGPLSNREISLILEIPEKSITGRTGELRDKGMIRTHGFQKNPSGRKERTWEVIH
jgi:hypothetical protein